MPSNLREVMMSATVSNPNLQTSTDNAKSKSCFVHRLNRKVASCHACSRSFWSVAKALSQNFCQSYFPPLKTNFDSSTTPSSKANLFALAFTSNSGLDDQVFRSHRFSPSNLTTLRLKFSTQEV